MWIVSSKNVGMLLRDKADIDRYPDERYQFAKNIALVWMNKIEDLKEKGQLEDLKKEMANKTLVGEYIGN